MGGTSSSSTNTSNFESSLSDFPDLIDLREFSIQCASLNAEVQSNKVVSDSNTEDFDLLKNLDLGSFRSSDYIPTANHSNRSNKDTLEDNISKYTVFNDIDNKSISTHKVSNSSGHEINLTERVASSRLASIGALVSFSESEKPKGFSEKDIKIPNLFYENQDQTAIQSGNTLSFGDIILSVSVYPNGRNSTLNQIHKQEFEVKGTDSLSVLQEQFYCLSKRIVNELVPDVANETFIRTSSFVLIEDNFYDDPMADDSRPSDIYMKALKVTGNQSQNATNIFSNPANVKQLSLKHTQWIDLKVRLNRPYLFVHLGGCEHSFIITQVRAFNPITDSNILFPRKTLTVKARRRKCRVCEVYAGSKILLNDKLMHENPCIICDKCFTGFHPENDVGYSDFETVPYYHEI